MAYDAPRVRPARTAPRSRAVSHTLSHDDVKAAAERIAGQVRPVAVAPLDLGSSGPGRPGRVHAALEFAQHTGSFKARGAANFVAAHREAGTLPEAGVTIASGGNAGVACAWAARAHGVRATVFLPATAPAVKVDRLRKYGAEVRLTGSEYAEALAACETYAAESGALPSHAYDHPLIAAGAGTLVDEIRRRLPALDTLVVAVGGGGLFAGVATAARHHGLKTVAVEPTGTRALHAALAAGEPVDVAVDSVAADSLGARRAGVLAFAAARHEGARSVLVSDEAVEEARRTLWEEHRFAVEHGAATALAALTDPAPGNGYVPAPDETVCVVLCGANTDPATL
ncbi:threonine/serine dehydratase [Streptomyces diastaticus]|uniref:threonine/serine dehydratase n=1 Tax=Streptomyces diastaticus TaxID=1956 RepID=UPI003D172E6D